MSTYDDLFTPQESGGQAAFRDQPFDKEAWAQQKKEQRELVYGMIDNAAISVAGDGASFQKYLDVQSRFSRYSVSNALLILAQRPDATVVKDFDSWKDQGLYIRKKEAGFYILEPGDEYERDDGTTGISYNAKKVFDISQTGAIRRRETPVYPDERTRIKALTDHSPVPIRISDSLPEGVQALYQPDQRDILVRRGMDASSIFRALAQELAHAEMDRGNGEYVRSEHGFHAYCASYMLCRQYGVETGGFSFERAPEMFESMSPQEVRNELSIIREATSEISGRMEKTLNQQRQQRREDHER